MDPKYRQYINSVGRLKADTPVAIKQEIFIDRALSKHGGAYTYDKVVFRRRSDKVTITCRIHGDFSQTPDNHLRTGGCPSCSKGGKAKSSVLKELKTTEDFVFEANNKHNNKYDYSNTVYNGEAYELLVGCKDHGNFVIRAASHLHGTGCPVCGGSDNSDNHFVYILFDGTFYKIGITNNMERRFNTLRVANRLNPIILATKTLRSKELAKDLESHILGLNYVNPYAGEKFDGHTEWRSIDNIWELLSEHKFVPWYQP